MPVRAWATGGRQQRVEPNFGHIWDHFAVVYEWENGARAHLYCRQQDNVATGVADHIIGTKGVADIASNFSPKKGGPSYVIRQHGDNGPGWRLGELPKDFPNAYQVEHNELFASIRAGKPLNSGERVPNSAMMAIMGRMAGYSGQIITWKDATNAKEDLFPKEFDLKGHMETPEVAVPGKTKIV
jgi:predicted dehydrogenase